MSRSLASSATHATRMIHTGPVLDVPALANSLTNLLGSAGVLGNHSRMLKTYHDSFLGRAFVSFLVARKLCHSRAEAVEFGTVLLDYGVIKPCNNGWVSCVCCVALLCAALRCCTTVDPSCLWRICHARLFLQVGVHVFAWDTPSRLCVVGS